MYVSQTVLEGFSLAEDVEADKVHIDELLDMERAWYADTPRYPDNDAILNAAAAGELVFIGTDENVRPVKRFRNPDLHYTYPPYLAPHAAATLGALGMLWRIEATKLGIHPDVRLAVTSLTRSREYQKVIVTAGKLGVLDSTHQTGGTFDFDLQGYSVINFSGTRDAVVSTRKPAKQETIAEAFETDYRIRRDDPIRLGPEWFMPEVPRALLTAAQIMFDHGCISMVPEMVGTKNSALHVAAIPPHVGELDDRLIELVMDSDLALR